MANRGTRGAFLVGKLGLANGVQLLSGAGAPVDGTTGAGDAGPASLYFDVTNKALYRNTGTKAAPVWNALAGTAAITREEIGIPVINKSGSSIAADKLVALAGLDATSGRPKIVLADADVAAHDDVWVTTAAIANNAEGTVVGGALSAATLNTDAAAAAGDPVYLDTTAGGFTVTAPTGATARVQPVGFVVVKSATLGQILWSIGPGRSVGTNELQDASISAAKLASNLRTGFIPLDITNAKIIAANVIGNTTEGLLPDGNTDPSLQRVNGATDKALRVIWGAASVVEIQLPSFAYPPDLDDTAAVTVKLLARMAGAADTPTIAVGYFEGVGDTNAGGNTGALSQSLAAPVTRTIAAADIGPAPNFATITLTPAAHGTDALWLYAAWVEYTRKS
jgi:hypothetical protein